MKRINKIKLSHLFAVVFLITAFVACGRKDEFIKMISTDKTTPEPIKEYHVVNFNGGAHIVYKLPKVDNILYVQADYDLSGGTERPIQTRSSYFTDTITVEGFKESAEYEVKLKVVSRADVASESVTVKVQPEKPVYQLVAEKLTMQPDFQGVRIKAQNENRKNVGIVFLDKYEGKFSIRQQNFSDFKEISYAVRDYKDTIPNVYGAYVTDKWGNRSDTIFTTVKPLYEKTLDKAKFFLYQLPSETPIFGTNSYPFKNMWDGVYNNFWATIQNSPTVKMPIYGTLGLGNYVKLSRLKYTPRQPGWEYRHGNPKIMSLWGSDKDNPGDFVVPIFAEVGTKIGDWENIGNFEYDPPPSGASPTAITATDKSFFNDGVEFEIPFSAPKVKYLRIAVSETWTPGTFTQGGELDIFGDDR